MDHTQTLEGSLRMHLDDMPRGTLELDEFSSLPIKKQMSWGRLFYCNIMGTVRRGRKGFDASSITIARENQSW